MAAVSTQELPAEIQKFIQAKTAVLNEELVIDGKTITVAQLAQSYRYEKTKAAIFATLALVAVAMAGFAIYWFTEHPKEIVVFTTPSK